MTLKELKTYFGTRIKIEGVHKCWLWLRYHNRDGYGQTSHKGKLWLTHRLSFFLMNGWVPPLLDHKICDTRGCCHPNHVVPSTHKENVGRSLKAKEASKRTFKNKSPEWKANIRKAMLSKSPEWKANLLKAHRAKAKLTIQQVREIRRRYICGSRIRGTYALGRKYGVNPKTILNVVRNILWKDNE